MAFPPLISGFFADFRANIVDFLRLEVFLPTARLMPQTVLQSEVIAVVEDDFPGARPCGRIAEANAAEVFVIIGQTLAAGMIPVVPERAQVSDGNAIGITGNGFKKIVAVEGEVSGRFHGVVKTQG